MHKSRGLSDMYRLRDPRYLHLSEQDLKASGDVNYSVAQEGLRARFLDCVAVVFIPISRGRKFNPYYHTVYTPFFCSQKFIRYFGLSISYLN